ncbi:hypothetical protein [uncultured Brachyspira sp.]|uniref:hypothetical protein n=1 Tax=uncultured Brachyspira sp. TaxID=221953 RepID=UPI0026176EE0|nr:hypothetical protein [uncultured Brachyspira sp.]
MHKYLGVLLIVISMVITGCGESIYSGAENTSSKEAAIDDFDFSFLKNECGTIIERYDAYFHSGVTLSEDDLYRYVSAVLACSGFDIVKGLDSILQTGGNDIYETAAAVIGHKVIDINTAMYLQKQYSKAINICIDYKAELAKDNITLNNNNTNLTLCGLAGTMGTIVNLSAMLLNASGGGANVLELTEAGLTDFGTQVNPTIVGQSLSSFLKQYNLFLADLDSGLILSEDAAKLLGDLLGQDSFSSVLGELAASLKDPAANAITEDSLIKYISDSLGIEIPETIFPEIPAQP